jgi:hypothetical protein
LLRYCLQSGRSLSCPPTSQTVKATFLCSTFSTLKPARIEQPTFVSSRWCTCAMHSVSARSLESLRLAAEIYRSSAPSTEPRRRAAGTGSSSCRRRPARASQPTSAPGQGKGGKKRKNSQPQVELNHSAVFSNGYGDGVLLVTFTSLWQELSKKSFIRDWPMLAPVLFCPAPDPAVFFLAPPCSCVPARRVLSLLRRLRCGSHSGCFICSIFIGPQG